MWERAKSGAVVVFVTLLIWFAADQNVQESQTFQVPLRVMSGHPDRFAMIADLPHQVTLAVTLNARRRRLQEFSEMVNGRSLFEAVIDQEVKAQATPQVLATRDLLSYVREIEKFGMGYIRTIEPSGVRILINEYRTVPDVRVEPVYGELKVSATPSPAKVSVRLPGFLADELQKQPVAVADAEQRIRASSGPGGAFNVRVPLTLPVLKNVPPNAGVKILPSAEVVLAGRIEALTATKRKGPIQITWSIPDDVQRDYRVVPAPDANFRPDIDVSGPRDQIDQLDPRTIRAFVDVFTSDAEPGGQPIRRQVQFILPPGFTLVPGPPYELEFHLEPLGDDPRAQDD